MEAASSRLLSIDICRGFALLGVLLANLQSLTYPGIYFPPLGFAEHSAVDRITEAFIRIFAEGSFYPLFAALFGLGFAMQIQKPGFTPARFRKRLLILLSFGLLHAILVWEGDILVSYALLGFALVPLHRRSTRTLLLVISGCLIYSYVMFYLAFSAVEFPNSTLETISTTYAQGSYFEVTRVRLSDLGLVIAEVVFYFPHILACFLVGLLIGRREVKSTLSDRPLLRSVLVSALVIGLPIVCTQGYVMLTQPAVPAWLTALDTTLGSAALGFAYTAALLLLLQIPIWAARLEFLGALGRASLSNYLTQSLIFTSLYYGYGGGLYARVPLSLSVLLALVLFTLQVLASRWWLSRHAQGPVEALWRRLTYTDNPVLVQKPG